MAAITELPAGVNRIVLPLSPEDSRRYFEEICAKNPDLRLELTEEGEIVIMPPAGLESSYQCGEVFSQLKLWAEQDGTGIAVESSAGFTLPSRAIRAPDAAWVSKERLSKTSPAARKRFAAVAPDFAVEILSPSDEEWELIDKCRRYLKNGVRECWLINPETRKVFVFLPGKQETLDRPDKIDSTILPGFTLSLQKIWAGLADL